MHALEHGKDLDGRVRRACGQPKRVKPPVLVHHEDGPRKEAEKHGKGHQNHLRKKRNVVVSAAPSLSTSSSESSSSDEHPENLAGRLHSFLTAITPSKGFFFNLGDTTCKDKKFSGHAHQGQHCWNGIEIGAYNRTIVGVGLERQEINPELKVQKDDGANSKVKRELTGLLFISIYWDALEPGRLSVQLEEPPHQSLSLSLSLSLWSLSFWSHTYDLAGCYLFIFLL